MDVLPNQDLSIHTTFRPIQSCETEPLGGVAKVLLISSNYLGAKQRFLERVNDRPVFSDADSTCQVITAKDQTLKVISDSYPFQIHLESSKNFFPMVQKYFCTFSAPKVKMHHPQQTSYFFYKISSVKDVIF